MRAMLLERIASLAERPKPLRFADIPIPELCKGEVLIRVAVCGICHTEIDEIEGRTPPPALPAIPGHQIIGRVSAVGEGVNQSLIGKRVGVAWIHSACGHCDFCRSGRENLCPDFAGTGRDHPGGYAEYTTAPAQFTYSIPEAFSDAEAAPLLCAGAVGYRALRLTKLVDGETLGLAGFGASAHLVLQMARHRYPHSNILVFARSPEERQFALELGADWSGPFDASPPALSQAIIDTTPVWTPVLRSLEQLLPGGRLVINTIRKENQDRQNLLDLDFAHHLWLEKEIKTVANVTRGDVQECLELAAAIPLHPVIEAYPFRDSNRALMDLRNRDIRGAKVLQLT